MRLKQAKITSAHKNPEYVQKTIVDLPLLYQIKTGKDNSSEKPQKAQMSEYKCLHKCLHKCPNSLNLFYRNISVDSLVQNNSTKLSVKFQAKDQNKL